MPAAPNEPPSALAALASAAPGILWVILIASVIIWFRSELGQLLSELVWRLRCGAPIKLASMEFGAVAVVPGPNVSQKEKERGVRSDSDQARGKERTDYRDHIRDIMLVHRLYRSREDGQLYDIVIYVVPHKQASLAAVRQVEYFLGSFWGNKIFPSEDRSQGFAIATAAYGPTLCTAKVFFNDGTDVILHRYLDFEMGAVAPAAQQE